MMATALTPRPIGWVVPSGAPLPLQGAPLDQALQAAAKMSGSMVTSLQHPDRLVWWIFGDERMATVEPCDGGFVTRVASYPDIGMPALRAQLESLGWVEADGR